MDTQEIVWIVVAVVVVLALIALAAWLANRKKHQKAEAERAERAQQAAELRHSAQQQAQVLPDAELRAEEERIKAEKLRREAEHAQDRAKLAETDYLQQAARHEDHLREADRLDPEGSTPAGNGRRSTGELADDDLDRPDDSGEGHVNRRADGGSHRA